MPRVSASGDRDGLAECPLYLIETTPPSVRAAESGRTSGVSAAQDRDGRFEYPGAEIETGKKSVFLS